MSGIRSTPPTGDMAQGAIAASVGGGILTMALFPLAIPLLVLTVVATLPLLVPLLAAGLVVAVVAVPIRLMRRLAAARRRRSRTGAIRLPSTTQPGRP
jgi:hypothetical protein